MTLVQVSPSMTGIIKSHKIANGEGSNRLSYVGVVGDVTSEEERTTEGFLAEPPPLDVGVMVFEPESWL